MSVVSTTRLLAVLAFVSACGSVGSTEPASEVAGGSTLRLSDIQDAGLVTCPATGTAAQTGARNFVGTYAGNALSCTRPAPQSPVVFLPAQGSLESGNIGGQEESALC
ncbi:MAG: hypothetical protein ACT4PM_14565 [Gemmatimonadales bacterium]